MGTAIIGFAIVWFLQSIALLAMLWIMIKLQKFDYAWLPLIGSAFLASALDMIPVAGHFIAVPVLYFCIWKITRSTLFPDAAFTVVLSYALMRGLGWVLLSFSLGDFHATSAMEENEVTNAAPIVAVQSTNQIKHEISRATKKIASNISIKGVSHDASGGMVTIQYGAKSYMIPFGKAVSISTDDGLVTVYFRETTEDSVTLEIHGEKVNYDIK